MINCSSTNAIWLSILLAWNVLGVRSWAVDSNEPDLLVQEQEALRVAGDFGQRSVVQIETFGGREVVGESAVAAGPSSGTVVDSSGWIITSLFQFRGDPASITVLLPNGARKAAKLVARDHARELALIKIDPDEPLVAAVASPRSSWQIGQWTIALGKTFDLVIASRSVGILSATDRIFGRAIQTDCKISPHNYGGPLIDIEGRTMGVLAPIDPGIATEGEVQQWYDAGIGFAIPLEDILKRLPKLMQGEDIHVGKVGLRPALKDDFRGPVVLAGVLPGTPAAKAGLQAGDTLVKIDGLDIRWPNHMRHAFGKADAGDTIKVTIKRDDDIKEFDCQLVRELPVYKTPFLGVLPDPTYTGKGVKIRAVEIDSPASKAALPTEHIIRKIGKETVESIEQLERFLAFVDYREPVVLGISEEANESLQEIRLDLRPWPKELSKESIQASQASTLPPIDDAADKNNLPATGIVPLVMGDVKNQAFAFVPSTYRTSLAHGIVLMIPEPGKIERKTWVDRWERFCREHRFIMAVVSSADPEAWSMEELDIFRRTLQQIRSNYTIDSRRVVVGGLGAGSGPAIVLSLQDRETFRGLWIAGGNIPRGIRVPQVEPMESLAMLIQGDNPAYPKFAGFIEKLGYRVVLAAEKLDVSTLIVGNSNELQAQEFFASLEWL